MSSKNAIVIGSGIAGLASALRLRVKGYEVDVFEANDYPGGKLAEFHLGAYRFDAGPSLFTLPQLYTELFELAGKNPEDYFGYQRCDKSAHYFYEDGTRLQLRTDRKSMLQEIEKQIGVSGQEVGEHLDRSAFIYEKTREAFLENSLHRFRNYFSRAVLRCLLAMPRLQLMGSMHEYNEKRLKNEKLVQLFDRYATYNGSDPYQAPGILHVIPHLEYGIGTFFPEKGMYSIVSGLVKLLEDLGVRLHLNAPVQEILHEGKRLTGVKVHEEVKMADVVICNMDVRLAYRKLLPQLEIPKRVREQESSSSAMIFYWGINKQFPELDLHNIFFSENYREEFECIFKKADVYKDPTVYIHVSSKMCPSDAPEGKENWFVMVNVPSDQGQDWERLRNEIRQSVVDKLTRMLGVPMEDLIEEEHFLDPVKIEQRTGSYQGALYGPSSNKRMAAFFRHSNFSKIKGLYFVGGSVHPGGGIPLALLSAKISLKEIS
ncbi:MAG: phytoene desaturase [Bacteroidetes bacterium]|nr:MAG: phytoene desaturase [Bacteroidota bacterium]